LGGNFKVKCNNCETSSGLYNTEQEAIDAWNSRPREEELLTMLKHSQKAIENLLNALQQDASYDTDVMKIMETLKKYEGENE
jgi:hypothetical protein